MYKFEEQFSEKQIPVVLSQISCNTSMLNSSILLAMR